MAADDDRPEGFPALPAFVEDKYYRVKLWKGAVIAGRTLSPASKQVMLRGDAASEIAEAIYTAEEAPAPGA